MKTLYPITLILSLSFFVSSFNTTENDLVSSKKTATAAPVYNSDSDNGDALQMTFKRYRI